jgi:HSP90 family molecular chaperone
MVSCQTPVSSFVLTTSFSADDLPLNVSRETLQSTRFMAQAKKVLIKRFIQLMTRIAAEDEAKYKRIMKAGYSSLIKLGSSSPLTLEALLTISCRRCGVSY